MTLTTDGNSVIDVACGGLVSLAYTTVDMGLNICSECNKVLFIMRYEDNINTEHNMKTVFRAAVAQWKERLTRNGETRVQISTGAYF